MFDRIWALSAAVVLTGASTSVSIPGDSASSAAMVVIGTVTSASGAAMLGAAVDLYAWPADARQNALKAGESVPTTLLATATTNRVGEYTLQVSAAKLKAVAVESGYANLEIFSPVGGFWFFSYQTGSLPARPSAPVTVNLGGRNKPPSCGLTPQHKPYAFTGFKLQRQRDPAWAVVGQGYIVRQSNTAGDYVSFKYTEGSSHAQASALGVGISGYGFDAGYNGAGTHTSTAARSEGFAPSHGNAWFRTEFSTGQFRGICYGPANDSNIPYQHQKGQCPHTITDKQGATHYVHMCFWLIKSTGWFGGATTVVPKRAPRTPARFCAAQEADSHFDGDFGKAVEWSSGFNLGAALGVKGVNLKASFNGSAQTGYDHDAYMYFQFHHKGFMCGTNKAPAKAAILVARGSKT